MIFSVRGSESHPPERTHRSCLVLAVTRHGAFADRFPAECILRRSGPSRLSTAVSEPQADSPWCRLCLRSCFLFLRRHHASRKLLRPVDCIGRVDWPWPEAARPRWPGSLSSAPLRRDGHSRCDAPARRHRTRPARRGSCWRHRRRPESCRPWNGLSSGRSR